MHELLLNLHGQHELFEMYAAHEYLIAACNAWITSQLGWTAWTIWKKYAMHEYLIAPCNALITS